MVETEKVCNNHKVSSAANTSELVHAKSGVRMQHGGGETHVSLKLPSSRPRPSITRSTSAYYVFTSLPKVVQGVRPKTGYRNNVSRPRGAHDYFNVMWDPHIYRGTTTTLTSSLKQPDAENKSEGEQQQPRHRKRRGLANYYPASNNTSNGPTGINGYNNNASPIVNRSNRYRLSTKISSRSRTFPPLEGRHQVHVQTEEYLEDLSRDVTRAEVDAIVQTDPIHDELISSLSYSNQDSGDGFGGGGVRRRLILPHKSGIDASTQVLPGELVSFDERVQPVVEALVGKILEQALLETMEEEEIGALKAQQNRFLEKRKEEERELKRLQEQQERISAEKERLKKHLQAELLQQNSGEDGMDIIMDNDNSSSSSNPNQTPLLITDNSVDQDSEAYLMNLLPSVINSLRQDGLVVDQSGDEALTSVVPLWQSSSSMPNPDPPVERRDESTPDGYRSRMSSIEMVIVEEHETDIQKYEEDDGGVEKEEKGVDENDIRVGDDDEVTLEENEEAEKEVVASPELPTSPPPPEPTVEDTDAEGVDGGGGDDDTVVIEGVQPDDNEDQDNTPEENEVEEVVNEKAEDEDEGADEEKVEEEKGDEGERASSPSQGEEKEDASANDSSVVEVEGVEEESAPVPSSSSSQLPNGAIPHVESTHSVEQQD